MFFAHIAPLLAKGVTFTLRIASEGDQITVDVIPVGTASNQTLAAQRFAGTAAELDADFSGVMAGFADINSNLADQLEASRAVAKAIADEAAAKAAEKVTAKAVAKPAKPVSHKVEKPRNAAPGGLLSDEADPDEEGEGVGGEEEGEHSDAQATPGAASSQSATTPADTAQGGFSFGL